MLLVDMWINKITILGTVSSIGEHCRAHSVAVSMVIELSFEEVCSTVFAVTYAFTELVTRQTKSRFLLCCVYLWEPCSKYQHTSRDSYWEIKWGYMGFPTTSHLYFNLIVSSYATW